MKLTIQDIDLRERTDPEDISAYLIRGGWQMRLGLPDTFDVFSFDSYELVVPLHQELGDYPNRVADIVAALAEVESRSQLQVLNDLMFAHADILRPRLDTPDTKDGTVQIYRGVKFVQSLKNLAISAAATRLAPKLICDGRHSATVTTYLRNVRLGQSERGSYIVPLLSEVPRIRQTVQGDMNSLEGDLPFARGVMINILRGLKQMNEAAKNQSVDDLRDSVRDGFSVNFSEAVVEMASLNEMNQSIDFQFSWSPRVANMEAVAQKVTIEADSVPFLQEANRLLRTTSSRDEFRVTGFVQILEHAHGQEYGSIHVIGIVDNSMHRVSVKLPHDEYMLAVEAHKSERQITCSGVLRRDGRQYVLHEPQQLKIIDLDDPIGGAQLQVDTV